MKKLRFLGLMAGLIILVNYPVKAQYFYTSYGYQHNWHLPVHIDQYLYNHYFGYEVAHVHRINRPGFVNYNVTLFRNNRFLEVRFDRFGRVHRTIIHNRYPFAGHTCSHHCGYHAPYFRTYYPVHHYHGFGTTVVFNGAYPYGSNWHSTHNHYHTNIYVDKGGNNNTAPNNQHNPANNNNVVRQQNYNRNAGIQPSAPAANNQPRTNGNIRIPAQTQSNSTATRQVQPESRSQSIQRVSPQAANTNRNSSASSSRVATNRTESTRSSSSRGN